MLDARPYMYHSPLGGYTGLIALREMQGSCIVQPRNVFRFTLAPALTTHPSLIRRYLCCWRCRYLWIVCFALVLGLLLVLYLCRNCVLAFCASPSVCLLLVMLLLLLPSLLYLRVCLHLRPLLLWPWRRMRCGAHVLRGRQVAGRTCCGADELRGGRVTGRTCCGADEL